MLESVTGQKSNTRLADYQISYQARTTTRLTALYPGRPR